MLENMLSQLRSSARPSRVELLTGAQVWTIGDVDEVGGWSNRKVPPNTAFCLGWSMHGKALLAKNCSNAVCTVPGFPSLGGSRYIPSGFFPTLLIVCEDKGLYGVNENEGGITHCATKRMKILSDSILRKCLGSWTTVVCLSGPRRQRVSLRRSSSVNSCWSSLREALEEFLRVE